ncbi:MAG: hypothetical protein QM817_40915 [Archangium sp.]
MLGVLNADGGFNADWLKDPSAAMGTLTAARITELLELVSELTASAASIDPASLGQVEQQGASRLFPIYADAGLFVVVTDKSNGVIELALAMRQELSPVGFVTLQLPLFATNGTSSGTKACDDGIVLAADLTPPKGAVCERLRIRVALPFTGHPPSLGVEIVGLSLDGGPATDLVLSSLDDVSTQLVTQLLALIAGGVSGAAAKVAAGWRAVLLGVSPLDFGSMTSADALKGWLRRIVDSGAAATWCSALNDVLPSILGVTFETRLDERRFSVGVVVTAVKVPNPALDLDLEANIDAFSVGLAAGERASLPGAMRLVVHLSRAAGAQLVAGAKIPNGIVSVKAARFGIALRNGVVEPLLELEGVDVKSGANPTRTWELLSATDIDALVDVAANAAGGPVKDVLDKAKRIAPLVGLAPAKPVLNVEQFFANPALALDCAIEQVVTTTAWDAVRAALDVDGAATTRVGSFDDPLVLATTPAGQAWIGKAELWRDAANKTASAGIRFDLNVVSAAAQAKVWLRPVAVEQSFGELCAGKPPPAPRWLPRVVGGFDIRGAAGAPISVPLGAMSLSFKRVQLKADWLRERSLSLSVLLEGLDVSLSGGTSWSVPNVGAGPLLPPPNCGLPANEVECVAATAAVAMMRAGGSWGFAAAVLSGVVPDAKSFGRTPPGRSAWSWGNVVSGTQHLKGISGTFTKLTLPAGGWSDVVKDPISTWCDHITGLWKVPAHVPALLELIGLAAAGHLPRFGAPDDGIDWTSGPGVPALRGGAPVTGGGSREEPWAVKLKACGAGDLELLGWTSPGVGLRIQPLAVFDGDRVSVDTRFRIDAEDFGISWVSTCRRRDGAPLVDDVDALELGVRFSGSGILPLIRLKRPVPLEIRPGNELDVELRTKLSKIWADYGRSQGGCKGFRALAALVVEVGIGLEDANGDFSLSANALDAVAKDAPDFFMRVVCPRLDDEATRSRVHQRAAALAGDEAAGLLIGPTHTNAESGTPRGRAFRDTAGALGLISSGVTPRLNAGGLAKLLTERVGKLEAASAARAHATAAELLGGQSRTSIGFGLSIGRLTATAFDVSLDIRLDGCLDVEVGFTLDLTTLSATAFALVRSGPLALIVRTSTASLPPAAFLSVAGNELPLDKPETMLGVVERALRHFLLSLAVEALQQSPQSALGKVRDALALWSDDRCASWPLLSLVDPIGGSAVPLEAAARALAAVSANGPGARLVNAIADAFPGAVTLSGDALIASISAGGLTVAGHLPLAGAAAKGELRLADGTTALVAQSDGTTHTLSLVLDGGAPIRLVPPSPLAIASAATQRLIPLVVGAACADLKPSIDLSEFGAIFGIVDEVTAVAALKDPVTQLRKAWSPTQASASASKLAGALNKLGIQPTHVPGDVRVGIDAGPVAFGVGRHSAIASAGDIIGLRADLPTLSGLEIAAALGVDDTGSFALGGDILWAPSFTLGDPANPLVMKVPAFELSLRTPGTIAAVCFPFGKTSANPAAVTTITLAPAVGFTMGEWQAAVRTLAPFLVEIGLKVLPPLPITWRSALKAGEIVQEDAANTLFVHKDLLTSATPLWTRALAVIGTGLGQPLGGVALTVTTPQGSLPRVKLELQRQIVVKLEDSPKIELLIGLEKPERDAGGKDLSLEIDTATLGNVAVCIPIGVRANGTVEKPLFDFEAVQLLGATALVDLDVVVKPAATPPVDVAVGFFADLHKVTIPIGKVTKSDVLDSLGGQTEYEKGKKAPSPTIDLGINVPPRGSFSLDLDARIPIQRTFGPLYIGTLTVAASPQEVDVGVDARASFNGMNVAADGLGVTIPVPTVGQLDTWRPRLDGLGLGYDGNGVRIYGSLRKRSEQGFDDYQGACVIEAAGFGLSALGGLRPGDPPSFYVFAVLNAPLGGPPYFFLTGVAGGFGANRGLVVPPVSELESFPLLSLMSGDADALAKTLTTDQNAFPVDVGAGWFALGINFTSFVVVRGSLLATVLIDGRDAEVNVLGRAAMMLPSASSPIVSIELVLKISLSTANGNFGVEARLTENSWLFDKSCRLEGGFAFYVWFGGEHAGDFVITLGGYHPRYEKPGHFPDIPRLGFSWTPADCLVIKGEAYFALTNTCVMAGCNLEARFDGGSALAAWIIARVNILVSWKPFHYDFEIEVEVGVRFLGIEFAIGAAVRIWGPEFAMEVRVKLAVVTFTIRFGADNAGRPPPLELEEFLNLLPVADEATRQVLKPSIMTGLLETPAEAEILRVRPCFTLRVDSGLAFRHATYDGVVKDVEVPKGERELDLAPMHLTDQRSDLVLELENAAGLAQQGGTHELSAVNVPLALWRYRGPDNPTEPNDENVRGASMATLTFNATPSAAFGFYEEDAGTKVQAWNPLVSSLAVRRLRRTSPASRIRVRKQPKALIRPTPPLAWTPSLAVAAEAIPVRFSARGVTSETRPRQSSPRADSKARLIIASLQSRTPAKASRRKRVPAPGAHVIAEAPSGSAGRALKFSGKARVVELDRSGAVLRDELLSKAELKPGRSMMVGAETARPSHGFFASAGYDAQTPLAVVRSHVLIGPGAVVTLGAPLDVPRIPGKGRVEAGVSTASQDMLTVTLSLPKGVAAGCVGVLIEACKSDAPNPSFDDLAVVLDGTLVTKPERAVIDGARVLLLYPAPPPVPVNPFKPFASPTINVRIQAGGWGIVGVAAFTAQSASVAASFSLLGLAKLMADPASTAAPIVVQEVP